VQLRCVDRAFSNRYVEPSQHVENIVDVFRLHTHRVKIINAQK